jgi:hypothetical protein
MAIDAYSFIADGLSIIVQRKSCNRADSCAGAASDASILINCNWHDIFLLERYFSIVWDGIQ